jgi:hypothetical protein
MILRRQKIIRTIVPLLVLSISQLYVQASFTTPNTQPQGTSTSASPMIGRLEVHRGDHIRVDDNDADEGSTILDGQTLETSDCKSASVHLLPVGVNNPAVNELGEVELAANTKAVINYSAGKVKVTLIRGCARVQMTSAIAATIDTPDGLSTSAVQRGASDLKFAEICSPTNEKRDYRPTCVAPVVWGVVGGAGVVTALAIALSSSCSRGSDPSSNLPTGPCV